MGNIITPESNEEPEGEVLKYEATEKDDQEFFLMYHMNFQLSEVRSMTEDYRKWIIMKFITQKRMEDEMMKQQRLMQHIGPTLGIQT